MYGCVEGSGRVVLKEYPLSENKVIATITITVKGTIPPPTTPEGSLSADPSSISAPGSSLVTATYSPANLGVEIRIISGLQSSECPSGGEGASDRSTTRDSTTLTRTVYGCAGGTGKVELWTTADPPQKLDTLTIPVSGPPVPPPPTETSGSVSANRTAMDKGHSTTVTGTWTPSSREATLDVASDSTSILGAGGCPDGSGASDSDGEVSLQVHGCAVGSGTVELRSGGELLASVTITVNPIGTTTTPSGTVTANRNAIDRGHSTTVTGTWVPTNISATLDVASDSTSILGAGGCPDGSGASDSDGEVSLQVHGCAVGTGTVELRTANGDLLDTTTIRVRTPPVSTSGWIEAAPATIVVGQSTSITAGWNKAGLNTEFLINDGAILGTSSGCSGSSGTASGARAAASITQPISGDPSLTLWGCGAGLTSVSLRIVDGKILDTVTVTVRPSPPAPAIATWTREAYRFFTIGWSGHADYTSYRVEWRNRNTMHWNRLPTSGASGPRALMKGAHSADVRGLPYDTVTVGDKAVPMMLEVRVVGIMSSGHTVEGPVRSGSRGTQPRGRGHQVDHVMKYDLSQLPTSGPDAELASWIRNRAPSAAQAWAKIEPSLSLSSCEGDCPANDEHGDNTSVMLTLQGRLCSPSAVACVEPLRPNIEGILGDMNIHFRPDLTPLRLKWTNDKSLDGFQSGLLRYIWIDMAVVHEFGHTFGLDDYRGESDFYGIMDVDDVKYKKDDQIKQDDRDALRKIYESHTKNEGW